MKKWFEWLVVLLWAINLVLAFDGGISLIATTVACIFYQLRYALEEN